jgi:hypothetical protein
LHTLAAPRSEVGEELLTWTRGWVSSDGRFNGLLAQRHRDFVVLTTARLVFCSCGFFTRRPRRVVFDEQRDRTTIEAIGSSPGRRLRVTGYGRKPLRLELGSSPEARAVATALLGSEDQTWGARRKS